MRAAWVIAISLIVGGIAIVVWRAFLSGEGLQRDTQMPGAECQIKEKFVTVQNSSMSELFSKGEQLVAEMGYYGCHDVQRNDLVLVRRPSLDDPVLTIVRVVPGDLIKLSEKDESDGRRLLVNGDALETPKGKEYVFRKHRAKMIELYVNSFKGKVPPKAYFIFGTQPGGSRDSSRFGPVTKETLVGRIKP